MVGEDGRGLGQKESKSVLYLPQKEGSYYRVMSCTEGSPGVACKGRAFERICCWTRRWKRRIGVGKLG